MMLVTPDEMRQMDERTMDDVGLPGVVLMERAALGAVDWLVDVHGSVPRRVNVLCGGGNNGGDGIAMARMLESRGADAELAFLSRTDGIDGDAGTNLRVARHLELNHHDFGDADPEEVRGLLEELPDCDVWIDALLGTGLDGEVRGRYRPAIEFLNNREQVFAVDIPSGIDGETGRVLGVAVDADATATFGEAKIGQALYPGRSHCGRLKVVDIGIPDRVRDDVGATAQWLDAEWASARLDSRPPVYHKGAAGRVLALAGSHDKTGAALLAARGALRGGGGLVTVGTTEPVVSRIAPTINEVMAAQCVARPPDSDVDRRLVDFIDDSDVVAAGPGLERHDGARRAVDLVLDRADGAAVLDADALNLVAADLGLAPVAELADRADVVLTPHPGEMARLRETDVSSVLEAPVEHARRLAEKTEAIVVLKMASTVVAAPDGRIAVNRSGNPGMATGGMGDVLTGVIAARLAEGKDSAFDAAALAVWGHGAAGDRAAAEVGERGLRATELAERLPEVWRHLESDVDRAD